MRRFELKYIPVNPPSSSTICLKSETELGVDAWLIGRAIKRVLMISMGLRTRCVKRWLATWSPRAMPG